MSPSRDRTRAGDLDVARRWRGPSAVSDVDALTWTLVSLALLGGAVLVCSLARAWGEAHRGGLAALAGACLVLGAVLLPVRRRLPRRALQPLLALVTGLVTALVVLGEGGSTSVALSAGYLFVMLSAGVVRPLSVAVVHLVLAAGAGAVALAYAGVRPADIVVVEICLTVAAVGFARLATGGEPTAADPLTGLPDRRTFDRWVEEELHVSPADGARQLSLVLLDLDDLARVNRCEGHPSGDRLLQACARAWRRHLPEGACLARYGGDQFALLLPDTPLGRAADIADDLRRCTPSGVTVSAGVADRHHGDSGSVLTGRADVALYEAKVAGRDQTVVYGDPGRSASELEAAVAGGQLRIHFQPVVRLSTGEVVGFEALVRWEHPTRGLVPPTGFIPQAERTGAIHSIGAWLRGEVCRTVMSTPGPRRSVGVNVSVHELRRPDLAATVRDLLEEWSMPGNLLIVEVTESAFDDDDPQVVRSLLELRRLGVLVAIDDFGSGYSSLRRLGTLPIDIIKLDGALVEAIPASGDAPILQAIQTMGHSLGVRLVAEHVETRHQAAVLRRLGYELAQGYLFSRPAPWPEVGGLAAVAEAAPFSG